MTDRDKQLLMLLRAALIQALGAIEDALGLPRTVVSRRERMEAQR